jgi:3-dehydroquinate synthase
MKEVSVNLEDRSYKIYIASDFDHLIEKIKSFKLGSKALIVTDSNVDRLYSQECYDLIGEAGLEVSKFVFPAGETGKNLDTVKDIYQACMENKFERQDTIIALGGGVVGDIAGFAAATYLRGINFIQLPTSLIAQCDSSVGGKTGVDFQGGKNLVGAFYQPKAVYINVNALKTLPEREYISGLAEVVKHAVILDKQFFDFLEEKAEEILSRDSEVLENIVGINCSIKARVVESDEKENNLRAILNFGHTIGHAIESVLNFSLLHGECVALGMVAACHIASKIEILDKREAYRVINLLERLKLPVKCENLDMAAVHKQMAYDKKNTAGKINFILPKKIGEVERLSNVREEIVLESIKALTM